MAVKRALSVDNLLAKKYKLFEFEGAWYDAFAKPERSGVWIVWGNSGNGKTSFILQLIKCLSDFDKVLYNSLEEAAAHTMQEAFIKTGIRSKNILLVTETYNELIERLSGHKSPNVVVIDSFQYLQINYSQYLKLKTLFPKKLFVFVSHADGKYPAGRSARSVMYDASLKILVEGYKAFSKGRYIGPTGNYTIWHEGAERYWGEDF